MGDDDAERKATVDELLDNMGDPETPGHVVCPIPGCTFKNAPESVAAHLSKSTQTDHYWGNTEYDGFRDFRRSHGVEA